LRLAVTRAERESEASRLGGLLGKKGDIVMPDIDVKELEEEKTEE